MEPAMFKMMHLEEGARGVALYAPPEFHAMTAGQEHVVFPSQGPYDFAVLFTASLDEYRTRIEEARATVLPHGVLWVAFPKPPSDDDRTFGWHALWLTARREGLEEKSSITLDDNWVLACFRQALEKW